MLDISLELWIFQVFQELVPKKFVFLVNTIGFQALNTGEKHKGVRALLDAFPFLLSPLEELPQGLGRAEPFSKHATKDLENHCFGGSLIRGAKTDLFLGSSFQVVHQEVHRICVGMTSGCTFCIKDPFH